MQSKQTLAILLLLLTQCLSMEDGPLLGAENKLDDIYSYPIDLKPTFDEVSAVVDKTEVYFDDSVVSKTVIDEMGFGFNLGNTFDAWSGTKQNQGLESETCWGVTKTNEEMLDGLISKGFKTIRIPTTWHNHLIDNSYTIDPEWMKRIKTVVDWSLNKGFYVILNTHHDNAEKSDEPIKYGKGYYPSRKDLKESEKFLYNVWKQIAIAFNNGYDHHLIFETLNEPRPIGTEFEWNFKKGEPICEEASSVLNEFNRLIVKAIRETGGNNEKRFIMVPPLAAAYVSIGSSGFIFPSDTRYNPTNPKILLSVHMYLPYNFAGNGDMSFTKFEESYGNELYSDFKDLYENYVLKGHHVVIGEMGTVNKNNTDARIAWAKFFIENSRKFQLSAVIWDNEIFDNSKSAAEIYGNYHRKDLTWENDTLIDAYIEASDTELLDNPPEEFKESLIETPFEFNDWSLNLFVGSGIFSTFNSYSKLCFTSEDPTSFIPQYRSMILFLGDWSNKLNISKTEMKGASYYEEGSISINRGTNEVEITLNERNMQLAKERGIFIIGYGFSLSKIFISGPKLAKMEPLTLTKSTKNQKVNFYFSEDASLIAEDINFVNAYHDLNENIKCTVDESDNTVVVCEGAFDFTGEYRVADKNGVFLSSRAINVIPAEGEKYDINNLIGTSFNFDRFNMDTSLSFNGEYFKDANQKSFLVIETGDLVITPSYRALYFFQGKVETVLTFNAADVNVNVGADSGLIIPEGNRSVRINLKNTYTVFKNLGVTIKGYGFSIKSIYLE